MNGNRDDNANMSGNTTTVVTGTSNEPTNDDNTPMDDAEFVSWAMTNNEIELDLIRLAKTMATDSEVKELAMELEIAHGSGGQKLADYAEMKNINVDDDDADNANQEIEDNIESLRNQAVGAEWDQKRLDLMINMHEDAIAKYKDGGDEADDQALKDMISTMIPELQSHLDELRTIEDRLDG